MTSTLRRCSPASLAMLGFEGPVVEVLSVAAVTQIAGPRCSGFSRETLYKMAQTREL
jgi:hypothetical protein